LGMAVAVGSLALAGGVRSVRAEAAKRIEPLAPELDTIISSAEPIQELAEGFGGPLGPAEGPVWWQEGGYLLLAPLAGLPPDTALALSLAKRARANPDRDHQRGDGKRAGEIVNLVDGVESVPFCLH